MGYSVKKKAVLAFERRSKVVYDLIEKKLCGPFLGNNMLKSRPTRKCCDFQGHFRVRPCLSPSFKHFLRGHLISRITRPHSVRLLDLPPHLRPSCLVRNDESSQGCYAKERGVSFKLKYLIIKYYQLFMVLFKKRST